MDRRIKEIYFNKVKKPVELYVRKFGNSNYEDSLSAAYIGVWKHLDKFDHTVKGAKLLPWCLKAARVAIIQQFRESNPATPTDRKKAANLKKIEEELRESEEFQIDKLLELSGLSYPEFVYIQSLDGVIYPTSLDVPVSRQGDKEDSHTFLIETLPDKEESPVIGIVREKIQQLSQDEQLVIILHDLYGYNMDEIAAIDGKKRTSTALYRIWGIAFEKLKGFISSESRLQGIGNRIST